VKVSARADDDRGDFFRTGGTALIQGARWEGWVGDAGTFADAPTAL
jgi:hypothetical protein